MWWLTPAEVETFWQMGAFFGFIFWAICVWAAARNGDL